MSLRTDSAPFDLGALVPHFSTTQHSHITASLISGEVTVEEQRPETLLQPIQGPASCPHKFHTTPNYLTLVNVQIYVMVAFILEMAENLALLITAPHVCIHTLPTLYPRIPALPDHCSFDLGGRDGGEPCSENLLLPARRRTQPLHRVVHHLHGSERSNKRKSKTLIQAGAC